LQRVLSTTLSPAASSRIMRTRFDSWATQAADPGERNPGGCCHPYLAPCGGERCSTCGASRHRYPSATSSPLPRVEIFDADHPGR
jgi:hypothetical protein